MISRIVFVFALLLSVSSSFAQVLRDINYSYLYNPEQLFAFRWNVIKANDGYQIYFLLSSTDTSQSITNYTIQWDVRNATSEKNGRPLTQQPTVLSESKSKISGLLTFSETASIIVASVSHSNQKKTWVFYKQLPATTSPTIISARDLMMNNYVLIGQSVEFSGFNSDNPLIVSYYNDPFPAAAPAFATKQSSVSKTIKPDSIFTLYQQQPVQFKQKGLYLAQLDTASEQGFSFRVEDDYPKLGKLESLADPLIYLCTKQEYEKLKQAGSDKKKFDQIVLGITGNAERARIFMRNYYKRIEYANLYFTSYKEGWKTDRGMIYTIYGAPDEVYFFDAREVWEYKTDKQRFHFVKSPTLFDPNNYVLIREKKFTDGWYQKVDLWRKARF
jgi:GWxTD domain-containing protein